MIRYTQGNLLAANADALVNTVNTVGVSGKGIALMFKEAYPDNFRAYQAACKSGHILPGEIFITERNDMLMPRFIINFATKDHWRQPSQLGWIRQGLIALKAEIIARSIRSIAIPPLGAGNGGLNWQDVKPLIIEILGDMSCEIIVYEPTLEYQNIIKRHGVEELTPTRALIAEMIRRYEIIGCDCSILEAQKLAWFLHRACHHFHLPDPIGARFQANRYGPYSDDIRHLLDSLDGSYLSCDRRVADARPFDPIRFKHNRQDRLAVYLTSPETARFRDALDHACAVIDGFQSPHGLELLASIDWLHHHGAIALDPTIMKTALANWPGPTGAAERKVRIFTDKHIATAVQHLSGFMTLDNTTK